MSRPLKPHHLLSELSKTQCDIKEATIEELKSKEQSRREKNRIYAARYRAKKKQQAAQDQEEERKRITREKGRIRAAKYYANKKAEKMSFIPGNNSNNQDISTALPPTPSVSASVTRTRRSGNSYGAAAEEDDDIISTPLSHGHVMTLDMQSGKNKYFYSLIL
jgi:Na+-translocating ferredoxin:NAD+ oxidoreductase RnfC subunit